MRKMLDKNQKGFTLIELLVVIAIIGILAAVAIPQFASYRENAFCSQVETDVTNAMIASESFFVANDAYPTAVGDLAPAFVETGNVAITITSAGTPPVVTVAGTSTDCTRGTYTAQAGAEPSW